MVFNSTFLKSYFAYLSFNILVSGINTIVFGSWSIPIGLPQPEFGIHETHYMYKGDTFDYNGNPGLYKDAGYGPYTHYIDNTHQNATDENNLFGDESKPRRSIPINIKPGSVIEIHGGPYEEKNYFGHIGIIGKGTAKRPIFVRGYSYANKIIFKKYLIVIRGSYIILENTLRNENTIDSNNYGYIQVWTPSDHISIRNNEATNFTGSCSIYSTQPKKIGAGGHPDSAFSEHIVFYNNLIHNNGYPVFGETGIQSICINGNSKNVWIVDNEITYGGEDGIHIIHQHNDNSHHMPDSIFIGRNIIHHHGENAIDIKRSKNVIVSQNILYGFKALFERKKNRFVSNGDAITLNDEGLGKSSNHFILFNNIYDCDIGITTEYDGYIIGNLFHNIKSIGINGRKSGQNETVYIVNNTFYNVDVGIYFDGIDAMYYIYNNIISKVNSVHLCMNLSGNREIENNLFWNFDGKSKMRYGSTGKVYSGLKNFPSGSKVKNCFESNPSFISLDISNNDFLNIDTTSLAINNGSNKAIRLSQRVKKQYNIDIIFDFRGIPRQGDWDVGAYENGGHKVIKNISGIRIK